MKKVLSILGGLTLLTLFALPVLAKGPSAPAGNSNKGQLYLYQKDSSWGIVGKGAWGKMTYDQSGPEFNYVFNGHQLVAGGNYTLIYYPDPWPGNGLVCLGDGMANNGGNLNIENSVNTGNLPAPYDTHPNGGAKIWLVLTSNVNCTGRMMTGWNPDSYLFEDAIIHFVDTDTNSLNLYQKDSNWVIVPEGAFGIMAYSGDSFVFEGHKLVTGTGYSLIYYPEPQTTWPWPIVALGSGVADGSGNVNLYGAYTVGSGQKYWLVLTSDLVSGSLSGYHPTQYLLEGNLTP